MSKKQVGRLAFRREGPHWTAYWAEPDTMQNAVWLGAVPIAVAERHPDLRERWMTLMRDLVTVILREQGVPLAGWGGEQPAPAHERSGHS
jgi:hypothetical protein